MDDDPHATPSPVTPALPRSRLLVKRAGSLIARVAIAAVLIISGAWATAALSMADLDGARPRIVLPCAFAVAFVSALTFLPRRRLIRLLGAATLLLPVAGWYWTIWPSNDRAWAPQYARLATATIDGDHITLHNYRTLEAGADGVLRERYVDQTFDLGNLVRADLIMSYWGPKRIAHALVSFEFSDGRYAAESIEVRRRASQKGFAMAPSLFRNFELIYVVGDERALIGPGVLDDHHRVYLFRTNISTERSRALFLRYANKLNELAADPQWYNAITDNCTTGIYLHLREIPPPPPFSFTILVNGYLPEYIYRQGNLDTSRPWPEFKELSDIKEAGRRAYHSPEFSRLIRQRVPLPSTASSGGGATP